MPSEANRAPEPRGRRPVGGIYGVALVVLLASVWSGCSDQNAIYHYYMGFRPSTRVIQDGAISVLVLPIQQTGWHGRLIVVRGGRVHVAAHPTPERLNRVMAPAPLLPFAAIPGGFFDDDTGRPMGLVRREGENRSPLGERGGDGIFLIQAGEPQIVNVSTYTESAAVSDALQSVDPVVQAGRSLVADNTVYRRAARSAVVIDAEEVVHFVIAFDDRSIAEEHDNHIELNNDAAWLGPTLAEWGDILVLHPQICAQTALGLDAGNSLGLIVRTNEGSIRVEGSRGTMNALVMSDPPQYSSR